MSSLIPRVIVAGLGAAVSPVAITLLITVMFRDHARRNSLFFLLGFTVTLVAIGLVAVFLFHTADSGGTGKIDDYIDMGLGVLCLAAVPLVARKKPKQSKEDVEKDLKASRALSLGVFAMLVNSSTMVIYIAGVHEIIAAKLGKADGILAMAVLTLLTLVTLIIPIVIYFIFPKQSQRVLQSVRTWLQNHMKEIGMAILVIFGVYLLVKGIVAVA